MGGKGSWFRDGGGKERDTVVPERLGGRNGEAGPKVTGVWEWLQGEALH